MGSDYELREIDLYRLEPVHCPRCEEQQYIRPLYEVILAPVSPGLESCTIYQCDICEQSFAVLEEASNG